MGNNPILSREQLLKGKIPGKVTGIEIKKTICAICPQNCGVDAYVKDGIVIKVEGSVENANSCGTLCSKGAANRQYIYHPDRIMTPLLKKGGKGSETFDSISWDDALDIVSSRLLKIKKKSGPESVIFFSGIFSPGIFFSGFQNRLGPFLKRLALGFGTPNYCTESSTGHFATVIANKLNYGQVGYPDIEKTKCLLVWSTNPFHSGTSKVRNLLKAIENGLKIIEVNPLTTPLTPHAKLHLRIRPGTAGALALGMAHVIIKEGLSDWEFISNWTVGFEEYRDYVKEFTPSVTEKITTVPEELIIKAARLYANTKPAAMMTGSSSTVHHTNAVQNHRAITALIGLTGNFDKEGGNTVAPSSYYRQPTGLKAREHEFEQIRSFDEMPPRIGEDMHPVWCEAVSEAQSMQIPFQIQSGKPYPIKALVGFGMNYR
ncbi:MAG: molybdopterin-dependent oxidoreductase, partial [Deltaproteobacteria bacterium]|nr:molybdopterin-dependent oxidoreductase [Deltaproteobacteria bacterium]